MLLSSVPNEEKIGCYNILFRPAKLYSRKSNRVSDTSYYIHTIKVLFSYTCHPRRLDPHATDQDTF